MSNPANDHSALDLVKMIVFGAVRVVIVLAWWTAMLFLASVFLIGIWKTEWTSLILYAVVLTVITCAACVIVKVIRRNRPKKYQR